MKKFLTLSLAAFVVGFLVISAKVPIASAQVQSDISVKLVSSNAYTTGTNNTIGVYQYVLDISASSADQWIELSGSRGTNIDSAGFNYQILGNANTVVSNGTTTISIAASKAAEANNRVKVSKNETVQFSVNIYYDAAYTGSYRAGLYSINFASSNIDPTTQKKLSPPSTYRSRSALINGDVINNSVCTVLTYDMKVGSTDTSTNGDVSKLQTYLNSVGYFNQEPTGYYGRVTGNAVKSFQDANGIYELNVGPITRAYIAVRSCGVPTATINYPNGGEVLKVGTNVNISFTVNNASLIGQSMPVYLVNTENQQSWRMGEGDIILNATGTQVVKGFIYTDIPAGDKYKMRLDTCSVGPMPTCGTLDFSDDYFTIEGASTSMKPTAILTANGSHQTTIISDSSVTLNWESTNGTSFNSVTVPGYTTNTGEPCKNVEAGINTSTGQKTLSGFQAYCNYDITYYVGGAGGNASDTVTVNVNPVAVKSNYVLTVNKNLSSAIVNSSAAGITCGSDCTETYVSGTKVTLSIGVLPGGYYFSGWTGGCTGNSTTCTVTMNANKTVTANFASYQSNTLTVKRTGVGLGTVASNPAGINCGADCTETYVTGSIPAKVTLSLTYIPGGYYFGGWSGACTGTGSCVITMDASKTVTANFKAYTFSSKQSSNVLNAIDDILSRQGTMQVSTVSSVLDFLIGNLKKVVNQ